jgi:hypothetical protein
LHWYVQEFFLLSKSRATTFGGAFYIPMSEILAYANFLRLEDEEAERFIVYIQTLDEIYLNEVNKDSKAPESGKESGKTYLNR